MQLLIQSPFMPIIPTDFSELMMQKKIYSFVLLSTAFWCLATVVAPLLTTHGGDLGRRVADVLYFGFSRICHQLDSRSMHVFGAKLGVCVRCSSIYFSFLAGLLVVPLIRPLGSGSIPGVWWLLAGIGPMVLDALLNDLGILVSTDVSRIITGSLAGVVLSFFILPLFTEAITQIFVHRNLPGDTRYAGKTE
jgi:uncharacterized membrane protein